MPLQFHQPFRVEASCAEQLTHLDTLLANGRSSTLAFGQVDQTWPWPEYSVPATTQQLILVCPKPGNHLHTDPDPGPDPDSPSPSFQIAATTPGTLSDELLAAAPRTATLTPAQCLAAPAKSKSKSRGRQRVEPYRKMVREPKPKRPRIAPPALLPASQVPLDDDKDDDNDDDNDDGGLEDYEFLDDIDDNDNDNDNDLPGNTRRRKTLERNRVAAKKCRVRKRDEASALAYREHSVEDQNRYLSLCFSSLSTEIYLLKTELLRHTHCDCTLIQEYITNETRRSVDRLNSSPSTAALTNLTAEPQAKNKQTTASVPAPEYDGVFHSQDTSTIARLSDGMPNDTSDQPFPYDADARWQEHISGQPMDTPGQCE
jgi:hypothetical protein